MRILIADDDATSRIVLTEMLKNSGHEVVAVMDGEQAWEVLQQPDAPALCILDWLMPGMDGLEVVRRVRALATHRPPYLIILTVKGKKADIVTGLSTGANDYLAKPFDPDELCARIEVGRRMLELQDVLVAKNEALRWALESIKTLRGIVPICANCKKIRDDQGFWRQVEVYIRDHTEAEFTHGICPECSEKLYPGFATGAESDSLPE